MLITETSGSVGFNVPGLSEPASTWYKIVGTNHNWTAPGTTPLVILHGGPGACHEYLLPHTDLVKPDRPVIFYDQIGNGQSTHLPDKAGDESFWTVDLFVKELDNLLTTLGLAGKPIDVLGHSWGGMLAAVWVTTPDSLAAQSLRRLIISSSLASMEVWREGIESLRKRLPCDVQKALAEAEQKQDFTSPEYEAAVGVFYKRHLSLARPWPAPEVQAAMDWFAKDPTTYKTMYGPSELSISGSLRNWTVIPDLHKINVTTLLINGSDDEAQDVAMLPFFTKITGKIKWVTLEGAAHFTHVDQRARHMKVVEEFLTMD